MDLFMDIKKRIGCNYISDLRYRREETYEVFNDVPHSNYSLAQLDEFCRYVFNESYKDFLKEKENGQDKE